MKKDCFEFEELISAAIDGELERDEFADLELHVDNCSECRGRYRQLESVNDLLDDYEQTLAASKAMVETSVRLPISTVPVVDLSTKTTESPIAMPTMASICSASLPGSKSAFDEGGGVIAAMKTCETKPLKPTSSENPKHTGRRLAMFAGGAFAAVGLAAMLTTGNAPKTEPVVVDASALTQTVQQVTLMNHESKRAQRSQTNTMSLELRALRLAAMNGAKDPEKQQMIKDKIASIQERLDQLVLSP